MKRITKIIVLLIFILAITQVLNGVKRVYLDRVFIDFNVYYEAVKDLIKGINPYQRIYNFKIFFNYPPSAFIFFLPFSIFSLKFSELFWLLISILSLLIFAGLVFKLYFNDQKWPIKLLLISLLFQNFPTKFTLIMGQSNLLVLLLITLAFWYYKKENNLYAGILLGLSSAIKIFPLFLLIFFLSKRKYNIIFYCLFTFLFLNAIFDLFCLNITSYYFKVTIPSLFKINNHGIYFDQSFLALFSRLNFDNKIAKLVNFLLLITGFGLIWNKFCKTKTSISEYSFISLILLWVIITNQFAWQHHFIFLFPAFLSAAFWLNRSKSLSFGLILTLAALLVGFHFRNPNNPILTNPIIASHGLWGALILGGLIYFNQS